MQPTSNSTPDLTGPAFRAARSRLPGRVGLWGGLLGILYGAIAAATLTLFFPWSYARANVEVLIPALLIYAVCGVVVGFIFGLMGGALCGLDLRIKLHNVYLGKITPLAAVARTAALAVPAMMVIPLFLVWFALALNKVEFTLLTFLALTLLLLVVPWLLATWAGNRVLKSALATLPPAIPQAAEPIQATHAPIAPIAPRPPSPSPAPTPPAVSPRAHAPSRHRPPRRLPHPVAGHARS